MVRSARAVPTTIVVILAALASACSDDVTTLNTGRADAGPADAGIIIDTGGNADAEPAPPPDAGFPADAEPIVDGGFPELDGGRRACGTRNTRPCLDTEYCDFPDNNCGAFDLPGVCQPRPDGCLGVFDPVCGCGGTVYSNECFAAQAGADLNAAGCNQDGLIGCGWRMCEAGGLYCRVDVSDVVGIPDDYTCEVAPIDCLDTVTCECLANEPCGDMCQPQADGAIWLVCPGG